MNKVLKEILRWGALVLGFGVIFTLFMREVTIDLAGSGGIQFNWIFNGFEVVFGASRTVVGAEIWGNSVSPECFVFNFLLFLAYLFPVLGGICCFAGQRVKWMNWASIVFFGVGALLLILTFALVPVGYGALIKKAIESADAMSLSLTVKTEISCLLPFAMSLIGCYFAVTLKIEERREKRV